MNEQILDVDKGPGQKTRPLSLLDTSASTLIRGLPLCAISTKFSVLAQIFDRNNVIHSRPLYNASLKLRLTLLVKY